jgi:hypothetical protein
MFIVPQPKKQKEETAVDYMLIAIIAVYWLITLLHGTL